MTDTSELPQGQRRVLNYFADAEASGHQASRAEVAEALGYAFPSAVTKHVEALVRKGLMTADRIKKRNVKLTEEGWAALGRIPAEQGVPVIGSIAAGIPILATENYSDHLTEVVPAPGRFALQVRGNSMTGAGIYDGDYAVIDHGKPVRSGQIAAVVVEDEATLKRVQFRGNQLLLESENKRFKTITVDKRKAPGHVEVVGPLRFVYRPF